MQRRLHLRRRGALNLYRVLRGIADAIAGVRAFLAPRDA